MFRTLSLGLGAVFCASILAQPLAVRANDLPWSAPQPVPSNSTMTVGANDAYRPEGQDGGAGEAYQPDGSNGGGETYQPDYVPENGGGEQYGSRGDSFGGDKAPPPGEGYGQPYSPPPMDYNEAQRGNSGSDPRHSQGYEQGEIIGAGHKFFGGITSGLANAVEYAFKSQGRPNGYILGEDAGGALILGFRYGEGTLYTKDAGSHKVFWQGPSLGYDAGAEGSKTMVLVYNMRDPSEIYERFGGVQGSAYLIGGVSVQFQKYNDVTLAVIRSGLGLRLGANIGYLKYTREPTWNPL